MDTIEEYYTNFEADLRVRASETTLRQTFVEEFCALITAQGAIPDADYVGFHYKDDFVRVDAYALDEEREKLTLMISDFRNADTPETIDKEGIKRAFKKLTRFVELCLKQDFIDGLEESDPVCPLAHYIHEHYALAERGALSFLLITDAKCNTRSKEFVPADYDVTLAGRCDIWDLQRRYDIESSGREREPIEIDCTAYLPGGIECLRAADAAAGLQSFLFVLPGRVLAELYDKYGERLLEQNVRSFLQFRGGVNKGIRNTVNNEPSMFFAYNNGLSVTGEAVELDPVTHRITRINNLQIVNGGQTTATLYAAWRKDKVLKDVYVQVKLSIVAPERVEQVVPRISEYANTQNKVTAADFFSNHPFHLRVESLSRMLWAPPLEGQLKQTKWFYERVTGQYATAQNRLPTASAVKKFTTEYPKSQLVTKTELSKYYLTCEQLPNAVCRGAQTAFARNFVTLMAKEWKDHIDKSTGENTSINPLWFKTSIAKAILFRGFDKHILPLLRDYAYTSNKSVIVTYAIAKLVYEVTKRGKLLDYGRIWQAQTLPSAIAESLTEITHELLLPYFRAKETNVTQLGKQELCWQEIQRLPYTLPHARNAYLTTKEKLSDATKEATGTMKLLTGVAAMTYVINQGAAYWRKLLEWDDVNGTLSDTERSILHIACRVPAKFPTEKQTAILLRGEARAKSNGFYVG